MTLAEALVTALDELDIQASSEQFEKFERYYRLLTEWNTRVNLTAVTEPQAVASLHFADSLLPLKFDLVGKGASCIDVGTGAGFPGIPIKIMRPDIKLTLLDSLGKRITFLERVCKDLDIDVTLVKARAEDDAHSMRRETFELVFARALAPMNTLCELLLPFARVGSSAVAFKGPGVEQEMPTASRALKVLHGEAQILGAKLTWGDRRLVCIKKLKRTPDKYPRQAGTPKRLPL